MYDPETYRTLYPYLLTGKIWFNHAATGPLSTRVRKVVDSMLSVRGEGAIDDFFDFTKTYTKTKESIAQLLHCTPDRIAFVDNTSNGLNILASGLPWKPGDGSYSTRSNFRRIFILF